MKRVWTLYRVSTDRQHDGEDIPLQRNACIDFIKTKTDWKLEKEVYEMGVSGYKLTAKERDEIEYLLNSAEEKKYDVLLVFMFDRLGRREDDTPIIVQTFCRLGVEVWSVNEGERRFDNHIDKLMNYITFWQASGESDKTSKRVTERLSQINAEGGYTGGTVPYGYELFDTGIKHPKYDKTIKNIKINQFESQLVTKIFDLVVQKGFGAQRIAQWLNENNYVTRNNSKWRHNYISRILRNSIYVGYKQYGYYGKDNKIDKSKIKTQPFNPDYVILDNGKFELAQQIVDKRSEENDTTNNYINVPNKSELLFSGFSKCAYCGHNLKADYSVKSYIRKTDGLTTKMKTLRYVCGHGKDKTVYHEAKQFGAKKYEKMIVKKIKEIIRNVDISKYVDEKNKVLDSELNIIRNSLNQKNKLLDEAVNDLKGIESLILRIELGKSKVPIENAENMLLEQNSKISNLEDEINKLKQIIDKENNQNAVYRYLEVELIDWEGKYEAADFNEKKAMLSRIVKSIHIKKNDFYIDMIDPLQRLIYRYI